MTNCTLPVRPHTGARIETYCAHAFAGAIAFALIRGRGLKPADPDTDTPVGVRPHTGARIETLITHPRYLSAQFALIRGRGLKHAGIEQVFYRDAFALIRGRGLKQVEKQGTGQGLVRPHTGARIETGHVRLSKDIQQFALIRGRGLKRGFEAAIAQMGGSPSYGGELYIKLYKSIYSAW